MSNKNSLRFLVVILSAAFATTALVLGDVGARAQNTNSSTPTPEAGAENTNANTAAPRRGRRRGQRRVVAIEPAGTTPDAGAAAGATDAGGQEDTGTRDLSGEQVDLSGTYTGRVMTTGGHEMSGEGTLTITGNTFTLAVDTMTHNGRVYSVLTRGATSAALYFADMQDSATNTPLVFNVRARKSGERLTLTPAPNTKNRMSFTPARGRR